MPNFEFENTKICQIFSMAQNDELSVKKMHKKIHKFEIDNIKIWPNIFYGSK